MDDEAILAAVDGEPDAFAAFYRRHAPRLMDYLERRTGDPRLAAELCAETFAAALSSAHRFGGERESAGAWLDGIARRLVARAEQRGAADERARRRLGMAPLAPGDRFMAELEEELVAAARFRAARRRPLPRPRVPALPRPPARAVRGALAGVAVLALVAGVAALARGGGEDPPQRPAAASGPSAPLVAMVEPARCFAGGAVGRPAIPALPYFSVFGYRQRADDELGPDTGDSLAVATYDPAETRLAANGRRGTRLHLLPSLGVSAGRGCAADDGPGVCLVEDAAGRHRCFTIAAVRAGLAFARTERGSIAGVVPDGIGSVTLSAGGRRASARVADNVYEAELGVPPGTRVSVELARPGENGCARDVAPGLLRRVAALRRAPGDRLLPMAGLNLLRDLPGIAEPVERGARYWGSDRGAAFWAVPVARDGSPGCAPAREACVVAVTVGGRADAHCSDRANRTGWMVARLYPAAAVVMGIVPRRATGARVAIGDQSAKVDARDNVVAGVLPFPYDGFAERRVEPTYGRDPAKPRVGVVDAAGRQGRYHAEYLLRRLGELGYPTVAAITPGINAQPDTDLYWWPGRTPGIEVGRLARLLEVDRVIRVDDPGHATGPVLRTDAPIVVAAGHGRPSP